MNNLQKYIELCIPSDLKKIEIVKQDDIIKTGNVKILQKISNSNTKLKIGSGSCPLVVFLYDDVV